MNDDGSPTFHKLITSRTKSNEGQGLGLCSEDKGKSEQGANLRREKGDGHRETRVKGETYGK